MFPESDWIILRSGKEYKDKGPKLYGCCVMWFCPDNMGLTYIF